ncbi:MAG: hypothetical protein HYZ59_04160 [Actinobacteria bacterium]|nr:hypothetical protein [Actinomycetota bacterium]
MISTRGIQWLLRVGWVVLPFIAGPTLADALHDWSVPLRTTASVGLWVAWTLAVGAVLIPGTPGLVMLRVIALGAPVVSVAALVDQSAGPLGPAFAAAVALLAFTPQIGEIAINAGSYGDERRYMLRPPGALYLGPLLVAWVLIALAVTAGPLLLADRRWVAGGLSIAVGAPVVAILIRAFHGLCQRWIVFVPAGVVLKDHHAVVDPVLFRRSEIELLHPAPVGTDAVNLTSHSPGLALELRLREKVPMLRVMPGRQAAQPGKAARLLFTPTRPGAVLEAASAHRVCVDPAAVAHVDDLDSHDDMHDDDEVEPESELEVAVEDQVED